MIVSRSAGPLSQSPKREQCLLHRGYARVLSLVTVPSSVRPLEGDQTVHKKWHVLVIDDAQHELRPDGVAFHRCAVPRSFRLAGEDHCARCLQEGWREHPVGNALAQGEQPLVPGLGFPINFSPLWGEIRAKGRRVDGAAPTGILRPCLQDDGVRATA